MSAILPSDTIFATVRQHGRIMTQFTLSGISSFAEIVRHLRSNSITGITNVELRNGTQGWNERHTLMLTAC